MAVYKRGGTYWYELVFNGERIRESTKQGNKRVAEQIEAAKRTQLAKGEVGIEDPPEPTPVPLFRAYAERVITLLKAQAKNAGTVSFYEQKLKRLLEFPALANCPVDSINRKLVNEYIVFARRTRARHARVDGKRVKRSYQVSPATVNRALATLRMILFHALEEGIVDAVPKIGKAMLDGERQRDFVLSPAAEPIYLEACPQPLQDAALLMLDTGLRVGEALGLTWPDIHLNATGSKFGYVHVVKGKSKNAKRDVPLTPRARTMLAARKVNSASQQWVFPNEAGDRPFLVTSLDHQQEKVRASLHMSADFVVHSFRHTMLTRLGLAGTDVFTIKKLAGHSSVQVSEKYVHPCSESNERAIDRMMSEYAHIGGRDTVDGDLMRASSAEHPHKSPHMVELGTSAESAKLLQ